MQIGFFIWTPLQVINAVNIAENFYKDQEVIYYLYKSSQFPPQMVASLKEIGLVETLDDEAIDQEQKLKKTARLFTNKNPFDEDRVLDQMMIPGNTYFTRLFYASMKAKNPELKLNYFEDGIGAYIDAQVFEIRNKVDYLIKKYNKGSIYHTSFDKSFVYEPDLVQGNLKKSQTQLVKIPKLAQANPARSRLQKAFNQGFSENLSKEDSKVFVFFDQPFGVDGTDIDEVEIYKKMQNIFKNQGLKLLVKAHPRESLEKYGQGVEDFKVDIPWELFMLNDSSKKVVSVGINTTALFTSYLLFGKDIESMTVINLLDENQVDERTKTIINNSKQMAKNFKEVMGKSLFNPSNEEELQQAIEALTK